MALDILGEAGIDLAQHVLPVIERPHLADGLVADAHHHAADVLHHQIDGPALGLPILLGLRQLIADAVGLARRLVDIGHGRRRRLFMGEVVDPGADVDDGLEGRMGGDILDALAVHPDLAAVLQGFAVSAPVLIMLLRAPQKCLAKGSGFPRRIDIPYVAAGAPMTANIGFQVRVAPPAQAR